MSHSQCHREMQCQVFPEVREGGLDSCKEPEVHSAKLIDVEHRRIPTDHN